MCLKAWQRLTFVLPEKFESKELGIIGSMWLRETLGKGIEYKPRVFQWHRCEACSCSDRTDGEVETSKPAPTLGSKYRQGKQDSAEGRCVTPRTNLTMRTEAHTAAQQARFSINGQTRHPMLYGSLHDGAPVPEGKASGTDSAHRQVS